MTAKYGDSLAQKLDRRIAPAAATTLAIEAIAAGDRVDGMLVACVDDDTLWQFSASSSAGASSTVLVPDAGSGRWLKSAIGSAMAAATLAATTNGNGASLVGIEDAATNFTATTVEDALAEIVSDLAATTATNGASRIGVEDSANNFTATNVETCLAEIISDLAATTATNGASRIGVQDSATLLTGTTVETCLAELALIKIRKVSLTIGHADLTDADGSQTINFAGGALPSNAYILGHTLLLATAFSGGGAGTVTVDVGGTDTDCLVDGADIFTGAAAAKAGTAGIDPNGKLGGQTLSATVAADVNVVDLTAGSLVIDVFYTCLALALPPLLPMANTPAYIAEPVLLGPSPARDMYAARIGSALTPRRIATILSDCDVGRPADWHDLLNELRQKDGLLHSVLQTRESALVAAGWAINAVTEPGARKPTDEDEETAAFCREAIGQLEDLDRAIDHLSDATYKGYSVVEVEWARVGKYVLPVKLHVVQGRRFAFDETQALRWWDDGIRQWPGDDVFSKYPARFLVHQPRVNGDAPTREGLGRTIVYSACFRNWAARDWMLFGELYGKPWRIITVKRENGQAQAEDLADAHVIADQATSTRPIVKSDAVDVQFKWPDSPGGAASSPAPAMRKEFGDEIALAVLGQLGTTGSVQNGLGGKGDAREKVRGDILRLDDKRVSTTMRRLLRNIVLFNLGDKRKVPHWSFLTDDAADTKSLLESCKIGVDMGMQIPTAYVHDVTGIPHAVEGEEILGGKTTAEPVPDVADHEPDNEDEPVDDAQDLLSRRPHGLLGAITFRRWAGGRFQSAYGWFDSTGMCNAVSARACV